jgi:hypothetical protein
MLLVHGSFASPGRHSQTVFGGAAVDETIDTIATITLTSPNMQIQSMEGDLARRPQ